MSAINRSRRRDPVDLVVWDIGALKHPKFTRVLWFLEMVLDRRYRGPELRSLRKNYVPEISNSYIHVRSNLYVAQRNEVHSLNVVVRENLWHSNT